MIPRATLRLQFHKDFTFAAAERHGETYHRIIKQMGADGWMGVGWPTEHGGSGRSMM